MTDDTLSGTDERPVERIPTGRSTFVDWAVMLGGPAIWISHFMVVYLLAEATCSPDPVEQFALMGADVLVAVTIVSTVLAAVASAGVAWAAWQRMHDPGGEDRRQFVPHLAHAGLLLAVGAVIGVLAVGLPAAYLSPVC